MTSAIRPVTPPNASRPPSSARSVRDAKDLQTSGFKRLIKARNDEGRELLRNGDHEGAFECFKKAEALLLGNPKEADDKPLLAVTCNNLGCYYKKIGKDHGALNYLRRALKLEVDLAADKATLAGTHMNLCAVLSNIKKHDKALQHALCALDLMTQRVSGSEDVVAEDDYAVLALAYYNVAMERNWLHQPEEAALAFQSGFHVASKMLGHSHPLTITLSRNSEVMVQKQTAGVSGKAARGRLSWDATGTIAEHAPSRLPEIVGAQDEIFPMPMTQAKSMRGEAADWIKEEERLRKNVMPKAFAKEPQGGATDEPVLSPIAPAKSVRSEAAHWIKEEERLWTNFATKAFKKEPQGGAGTNEPRPGGTGPTLPSPSVTLRPMPPLSSTALHEMSWTAPSMPKAHDLGGHRFQAIPPPALSKQMPLGKALDDHPQLVMDIINGEDVRHNTFHSAPNDVRPNRSMKRYTRTSLVARHTGLQNSMVHRDVVVDNAKAKLALQQSPHADPDVEQNAAICIQTVWRKWHAYCKENSEWLTVTWVCATMIQTHWRSYRVRRTRWDKMATVIQRHMRGFLVRLVFRNHVAAVTIQRWVLGMLTRNKLRQLHESAKNIQRLVRGGITRAHFRNFRDWKLGVVITIQQNVRVWIAKGIASGLRKKKMQEAVRQKAVIDLQRNFRGREGRRIAEIARLEKNLSDVRAVAAIKIQAARRRQLAEAKVARARQQHLGELDRCATYVQKLYLGVRIRRQYQKLRRDFEDSVDSIVTIQRYTRGCMTRLRLWREAVRAEEELWAAVEIQRVWRGYFGRVCWEDAYEDMWRRETSAALLQRHLRGWLVRLKVSRRKRKIARAAFEAARQRFRAAQRIQALARGVRMRKVAAARRYRILHAAVTIQRVQRGRALRSKMWQVVVNQRASQIQAVARGFVQRKRMSYIVKMAIRIQVARRRFLALSPAVRAACAKKASRRKESAVLIQKNWRDYAIRQEVRRVQNSGHFGAPMRLEPALPS